MRPEIRLGGDYDYLKSVGRATWRAPTASATTTSAPGSRPAARRALRGPLGRRPDHWPPGRAPGRSAPGRPFLIWSQSSPSRTRQTTRPSPGTGATTRASCRRRSARSSSCRAQPRTPQPPLHDAQGPDEPRRCARSRAHYHGLITFHDEQVGRIAAVDESGGLADDTVVIYTTDHGDLIGDFGGYFKGGFPEGSEHIPLIVRATWAPPAGAASPALAGTEDAADALRAGRDRRARRDRRAQPGRGRGQGRAGPGGLHRPDRRLARAVLHGLRRPLEVLLRGDGRDRGALRPRRGPGRAQEPRRRAGLRRPPAGAARRGGPLVPGERRPGHARRARRPGQHPLPRCRPQRPRLPGSFGWRPFNPPKSSAAEDHRPQATGTPTLACSL